MRVIIFLFVCLLCTNLSAQDITKVYFESNSDKLTTSSKLKLKNHCKRSGDNALAILLKPYSDNKGNKAYNVTLTNERLTQVERYLKRQTKYAIQIDSTITFANNDNDKHPSEWRKVEVIWKRKPIDIVPEKISKVEPQTKIDSIRSDQEKLDQVISSMEPNQIERQLNQDQDNVIVSDKGTLMVVQKGTFVRPDGSVPKQVDVKVKEYYSLSSFLEGDVTTETESGNQLETAGMVYIEATDEKGTPLEMKKSMTLGIPRSKDKPADDGMVLWDGKETDKGVVWNQAASPKYRAPFKFKINGYGLERLANNNADQEKVKGGLDLVQGILEKKSEYKVTRGLKGKDINIVESFLKNNPEDKRVLEENERYLNTVTSTGWKNCDALRKRGRTCIRLKGIGTKNSKAIILVPGFQTMFRPTNEDRLDLKNVREINWKKIAELDFNLEFCTVFDDTDVVMISYHVFQGQLFLGIKKFNSGEVKDVIMNYQRVTEEEFKEKVDAYFK